MAAFCKHCSIELFGEDSKDLAGEPIMEPWYHRPGLCEGCGITTTDEQGVCVSGDCLVCLRGLRGKELNPCLVNYVAWVENNNKVDPEDEMAAQYLACPTYLMVKEMVASNEVKK